MVIKTRAHGRPRFEYRLSAGLKTIPGVLLFFHVPSRFLPRSSLPRTSNTCRGLLNSLRHYDSTWLFLSPLLYLAILVVFAVILMQKTENCASNLRLCLSVFSFLRRFIFFKDKDTMRVDSSRWFSIEIYQIQMAIVRIDGGGARKREFQIKVRFDDCVFLFCVGRMSVLFFLLRYIMYVYLLFLILLVLLLYQVLYFRHHILYVIL